jgi:hypothetical membrane protein
MFSILAGLLYLSAVILPLFLLNRYRASPWPFHILAILVALGIGLAPGTALLNHVSGTMIYGFVFTALMVWGFGGLLAFHSKRAKQAAGNA